MLKDCQKSAQPFSTTFHLPCFSFFAIAHLSSTSLPATLKTVVDPPRRAGERCPALSFNWDVDAWWQKIGKSWVFTLKPSGLGHTLFGCTRNYWNTTFTVLQHHLPHTVSCRLKGLHSTLSTGQNHFLSGVLSTTSWLFHLPGGWLASPYTALPATLEPQIQSSRVALPWRVNEWLQRQSSTCCPNVLEAAMRSAWKNRPFCKSPARIPSSALDCRWRPSGHPRGALCWASFDWGTVLSSSPSDTSPHAVRQSHSLAALSGSLRTLPSRLPPDIHRPTLWGKEQLMESWLPCYEAASFCRRSGIPFWSFLGVELNFQNLPSWHCSTCLQRQVKPAPESVRALPTPHRQG